MRAWMAAALAATGCLSPTPFGSDPEQRDLNARALQSLRRDPRPIAAVAGRLTFAALGDTHGEYDDLVEAAESINRRQDVELIAHMGDLTDFGLLQEYSWAHEALSHLRRPLFVTIGNHDAISSGEQIYLRMYGPLDYSFVHEGVKFVFFNSNSLEFPGAAPNERWLKKEVRPSAEARAIVLVTHHPPWSSDAPRSTRQFYSELLETAQITAWIHGHLSEFQLVRYHGVPVLQCGTFQWWREYTLVTLAGGAVSFQRCKYDACHEVEPSFDRSELAP